MIRAWLVAAVLLAWVLPASAQQTTAPIDPEELQVMRTLQQIETALTTSDKAAWMAMVSVNADANAASDFFDALVPRGVTRAVVRERDRASLEGALPGDGYRLTVEVFIESGPRGVLSTWRLDIRRPNGTVAVAGETESPWRIVSQERLSQVDQLHRLALNRERPYAARDFLVSSVDFDLRLVTGSVFVADTADGVTALVLIGDGLMTFHPAPKTERGQVRLFSGGETVESRFDSAFVRVNPYDFEQQLAAGTLTAATPDPRMLSRAREVFDEEVPRSFSLDLSDMSRDTWSILPQPGDMLAEIRTRKYRTLTYARSGGEPEDVTFFSREKKRNIAIYASEQKLASRGPTYNEDELAEFDVLDYDIDVDISPERQWLIGVATMRLRIRSFQLGALNLKLNENFAIQSITSKELGRLLFLRVRNQSSVVVNLPAPLSRDYELTLTVRYQGRLEKQAIDSESIQEGRPSIQEDMPIVAAEPNWLLSNRAAWYPQSGVTDYATAALRVAVPLEYTVAASGVAASSPDAIEMAPGAVAGQRLFTFRTTHPVRYLGAVVTRMNRADAATVALDIVLPPPPPAPKSVTLAELLAPPKPVPVGSRNTVALTMLGNRRQEGRARDNLATTAEILRFYSGLMGDAPYPSFTVAMLESDLPGGHSPAYFAVLNNPLPTTPFVWRNDPATFTDFPEFILAHEVAHQWWGQAVGWKNYHEQWISEGFAQYFATLYAKERRGDTVYRSALRNLRRWAMSNADQGPISLGYRLGHVRNEPKVFRAVVYNKGAMVLHMLRRLVGDQVFFKGLRRFYAENRYLKAGTDDFQRAMEAESGKKLDRFFERWVLDSSMPRVRYGVSITSDGASISYEQMGDVFDLPVTATLQYTDGSSEEVTVVLSEASGSVALSPQKTLRSVELNRDDAALGNFDRK